MLTESQIQAREQGIGGSDAGTVLGVNPYKSPLELFYEKTGQIEPDRTENRFTHFGTILEQVVADEYSRVTGHRVARVNRTLQHPEHPWMRANIDRRIVGQKLLLECKTASYWAARDQWGEPGSDEVPLSYAAQCAHYLAVTGYESADLAVLVAGNDFRIYHIPRDETLIAGLVEAEADFWRCVETGEPPAPRTGADALRRWPQDSGEQVRATHEALRAVEELRELKVLLKDGAARRAELEDQLKLAMGEAAALVDGEGQRVASWKTQTSRRLDQKRLAEAEPDIVAAYMRESSTRVLRVR